MRQFADTPLLKRISSPESLPFLVNIGLALILCSKIYYLWGVDNNNKPLAPIELILLRDVFSLAFIFFFGFLNRRKIFEKRLFWALFFCGLIMSLIQLAVAKDLTTFSQHYIRNILIPLLFFPVFYGIFRSGLTVTIRPILIILFAVDLLLSYAQILFNHHTIRPTGLFGDPIINSALLLFGFAAVALSRGKISNLLSLILLIPLIQYLSSLSALLSVILGSLTVLVFSKNLWLEYAKTNFKKILSIAAAGLCLISFLVWITKSNQPEGGDSRASEKAQTLINSAFCKEQGCQHWSYKGRIESNLRPFRLCQQSLPACFLGNIQTSSYERIESTWGSLAANWGIIFCAFYYIWIFVRIQESRKIPFIIGNSDPSLALWKIIFYSGFYFSFLNTMPYKFPLNILWYASMAYLASQKNPTSDKQAENN